MSIKLLEEATFNHQMTSSLPSVSARLILDITLPILNGCKQNNDNLHASAKTSDIIISLLKLALNDYCALQTFMYLLNGNKFNHEFNTNMNVNILRSTTVLDPNFTSITVDPKSKLSLLFKVIDQYYYYTKMDATNTSI